MKIGFPVEKAEGMESKVYGHFGSAPAFVVVDTEKNDALTIQNQDSIISTAPVIHPRPGRPSDRFPGGRGIGGGALAKLNALGIKVYGVGRRELKKICS